MKTKISILIILFLGVSSVNAQSFIDSLSISIQDEDDSTKAKQYNKAFSQLCYSDRKLAKLAADSSYKYAARSMVNKLIGRSILNQGAYYYLQNQLDTALTIYYRAHDHYRSYDDHEEMAGALINIANCLGDKGDIIGSQQANLRSLAIQDSLGINGIGKGINLLNLGVLYSELKSFQESNKYYRLARKVFQEIEDEIGVAEIDFNLSLNLYDLDSIGKAQEILDDLELYHRDHNNVYNLIQILGESGKNHYNKGAFKKGEEMLLEAITLAKKHNARQSFSVLYTKLMNLYIKTGKLKTAKKYALLAYDHSLEDGNMIDLVTDLKNLSQISKDQGDFENAYTYHVSYHNLKDSLLNIDKTTIIEQLKNKYESEKKDIEIKNLNQEIQISDLQKGIYGIGFIGSLVALILGYFGFRQKMKNNKIQSEIKELELKKAIEFKQKELASQTLHLVRKNTFIQNLTQELDSVKLNQEENKREINKVLTSLKLEPELDKDWQLFKSYFTEVHNDFDQRIKNYYPNINENEMRLAYLMRMQLNSSEISAVMRVLPESVRKSKYRLKKKLNLEKKQDLNRFLIDM